MIWLAGYLAFCLSIFVFMIVCIVVLKQLKFKHFEYTCGGPNCGEIIAISLIPILNLVFVYLFICEMIADPEFKPLYKKCMSFLD